MPISPSEQGPYLLAAVLCERVIEEKDGMKSLIRLVDRVINRAVGPNPPEEMPPLLYELSLFVSLRAGDARGPHQLGVRVLKPSGETSPRQNLAVHFEGGEDRGVDTNWRLQILYEMQGLYWFELFVDNSLLTKIPFRVVYLAQRIGPGMLPPGMLPGGPS